MRQFGGTQKRKLNKKIMEIEKNNLFKKAFAIAFFFSIIGALLKINHTENSSVFLIIGIISTLIYIIIGIYEVNNSTRIKSSEKVMWTIGFITFSFFVGVYYFMSGRKNIV